MTDRQSQSGSWSRATIQTFGTLVAIVSMALPVVMWANALWPLWSLLSIGYGVAAGVSIIVWAENHVF